MIDRSDNADARRFRWLLAGNGYFLEEQMLCGHFPCDEVEQDSAREQIDALLEKPDFNSIAIACCPECQSQNFEQKSDEVVTCHSIITCLACGFIGKAEWRK